MARIYSVYQFDDRIVMIQVHVRGGRGCFRRDIKHVFRRAGTDYTNLFAAYHG